MTNITITKPEIDAKSSQWMDAVERLSAKNKPCAIPKPYFDVLKLWGLVEGTPGAATLSAKARGDRLMTKMEAAKKKTKKAKKK